MTESNQANLTGANLTNANLYDVDLTNADLTGANLTSVYLDYANTNSDGSRVYSIAGTASVGNPLSLTIDTQDPDGYNLYYDPSYSWQSSSDSINWTEIATSSTYTLTSADQGKKIKAEIEYKDGEGFDQSVTTNLLDFSHLDDGSEAVETKRLMIKK